MSEPVANESVTSATVVTPSQPEVVKSEAIQPETQKTPPKLPETVPAPAAEGKPSGESVPALVKPSNPHGHYSNLPWIVLILCVLTMGYPTTHYFVQMYQDYAIKRDADQTVRIQAIAKKTYDELQLQQASAPDANLAALSQGYNDLKNSNAQVQAKLSDLSDRVAKLEAATANQTVTPEEIEAIKSGVRDLTTAVNDHLSKIDGRIFRIAAAQEALERSMASAQPSNPAPGGSPAVSGTQPALPVAPPPTH